jgi:hypothetical protein
MHFDHTGRFVRTDIWHEGKYLDLWSIPHILSGIVVGLTAHFIGFATIPSFVIAFLVLVGYEMFEVIAKIEETRANRFLDVVVGMASFTPTFLFAPSLTTEQAVAALVAVATIDAVLSWFGWRASHKASVLEATMRTEYQEQMARLRTRRRKLRSIRT